MVAVFTPRQSLSQLAYIAGQNAQLPDAQFKGPVLYEDELILRGPPSAGFSMEPVADTWAGIGIAEDDVFWLETASTRLAGVWQLRTVISGEQRNVDPIAPGAEVVADLSGSFSSDPVVPNRYRGVREQTITARLSAFVQLATINHRARGTLGEQIQGASDNLRQLNIFFSVTGTWALGDTITGGSSGAVGTLVAVSPKFSQGGNFGRWLIVDMGVDYAGAEFVAGEGVTATSGGSSFTVPIPRIGVRSISPLFRQDEA